MISSSMDALALAEAYPDREVVFLAIGFETTTPPTAAALKLARARGIGNFSILCNHVLTPAAISNILQAPAVRDIDALRSDGFPGPAQVSEIGRTSCRERAGQYE